MIIKKNKAVFSEDGFRLYMLSLEQKTMFVDCNVMLDVISYVVFGESRPQVWRDGVLGKSLRSIHQFELSIEGE